MRSVSSTILCVTALLLLAACGGGGSSSPGTAAIRPPPGSSTPPATVQSDFERGVFGDPSLYKDQCAAPRGAGFPDVLGSSEDENNWLRAWSNDLYLWYDEIIDEDPALYATPEYFDLMKTFETTPSGADKDRFHFTRDTEAYQRLSQSGISAGYGAEFSLVSRTVPREAVVAYVITPSPAASAGLARGTRILEVDGVDLVNSTDRDTLNAGLFPDTAGETHSFLVEDPDGTRRTVDLVSRDITEDPVPTTRVIDSSRGPVGYLLFNAHIATAEQGLIDAVNTLRAAGITELVLDLRYNGGGFLDIANELAFMIAGPSAAGGRVFDELQFNAKHPTRNPVTGAVLSPTLFHQTTQGFSVSSGRALPSLNLSRVVILGASGTCSASEAIINGLRGIGTEVVLIGGPTCGKPYGFYPQDNCGTTYFSVQFRGVNAQGFGDYADGFLPVDTPTEAFELPGCSVADDFSTTLGDPAEARLATAINWLEQGECGALAEAAPTAGPQRLAADPGPPLQEPLGMPGMVARP